MRYLLAAINAKYIHSNLGIYSLRRYAMERLLECANEDKAIKLKIAEEDMPLFCSAVLPELEQEKAIETRGVSLEKYRPREAVFAFYLDEEDGSVTLSVRFAPAGARRKT